MASRNGTRFPTAEPGGGIWIVVFLSVRALDAVPPPPGSSDPRKSFFWNGSSTVHSAVNVAERTLQRVFEISGVSGAHSHRFRHTLATDILAKGGTERDVADILGITETIVRKHYAKWANSRQERIDRLMESVQSGTILTQAEKETAIH